MAAIHGVVVGGAPALGSEYIANGDFSAGSANWIQTLSEWVFSGGEATYTAGTGTNIRQTIAPTTMGQARVVYTVNSVAGGNVYFTVNHTGGAITGTSRSAPGTYTEDVNIAFFDLTQIRFNCTGTSCAIDNVSLKPFL